MRLTISLGYASDAGRRERNEDFCGAVTPEDDQLNTKGILLAVADGVSGSGGGREAAECTVRNVLNDYYATPDTWEVAHALDKVLTAANRWLLSQGAQRRELHGMASTLSLVLLRGNRYFLAHVGDTRVYRLRDRHLEQLTTDHVWDRPDMHHVLKRAVGLDQHLLMDYAEGGVCAQDAFVLVSDGVWEVLGDKTMQEILVLHADPQEAARALVAAALARNGRDNATALVARVDQVGMENWRDIVASAHHLPLPERLKPGRVIDDFEVLELLHESRATLLYKVRHRVSGQLVVLKTLQSSLQQDAGSGEALLAEEWLGKRIISHYFTQVLPLPAGSRHFLYYAMTFHAGGTLQQQLDGGRRFSVAEIAQIGIRLAKGLGAVHRLDVIHRDIKPANLHAGDDGKLRILDFGVALHANGLNNQMINPGTPSFMAPELFAGEGASPQADLYAAGVTLYQLLTRKYPYGEIEPFQHPRFGEPVPPTRYRPDIPQWLESIILKAVAKDRKQRFETAEEMLLMLERGERQPILPPPRPPLAERNPLLLWQGIAITSIIINLLLLYFYLVA